MAEGEQRRRRRQAGDGGGGEETTHNLSKRERSVEEKRVCVCVYVLVFAVKLYRPLLGKDREGGEKRRRERVTREKSKISIWKPSEAVRPEPDGCITDITLLFLPLLFLTGPGPGRYALPPTVGYVNHDVTKPNSPAYSLHSRMSSARKSSWSFPPSAFRRTNSGVVVVSAVISVDSSPGPRYHYDARMTRFGRMESPSYSILGRGRQTKKGSSASVRPDLCTFLFIPSPPEMFFICTQTKQKKKILLEMIFMRHIFPTFSQLIFFIVFFFFSNAAGMKHSSHS